MGTSSLVCMSFQEVLVGEQEYETEKGRDSIQLYKRAGYRVSY